MTVTDIKETETAIPEGSLAASALLRAVMAVKPVAKPTYRRGTAQTLPGRIRLDWTDEALTVTASDGETWASYEVCSAICTSPGSAVVQASVLASAAKTAGKITVSSADDGQVRPPQVRFTTDAGTTLLHRSADGWPQVPMTPADTDGSWTAWSIDPAHVREVLPAASTDVGRPVLQAIAFQPGAMVATDSYRLHYVEAGVPDYPNLLIPEHALRWIAKEQESVSLSATSDERPVVRISGGAQTWVVRTVDGAWKSNKIGEPKTYRPPEFPKWRHFLPDFTPSVLKIDRAEILRCVRHCMSIAPVQSEIPVVLNVTAGAVAFSRSIPMMCSLAATAVAKLDGPRISVAFNGRYLRDAVAAGHGDTVTMGLRTPIDPVPVTDDGTCARLIVPVHINN
jgi:hypothetical protein